MTQPLTTRPDPIHILSLGAGVQSSTMALMAAAGEITPMPDFGVFADTGGEPKGVYDWLAKLQDMLPFKIITAKSHRGTLHDNILSGGFSQIPCYKAGKDGVAVPGKQQCTNHWKLRPNNPTHPQRCPTTKLRHGANNQRL